MSQKAGVVAFAFGVPANIRSNERIAAMAISKSQELGDAFVYTQNDIEIKDQGVPVRYIREPVGEPSPTLRIARYAVEQAVYTHHVTELWIACAQPHLWRCKRDLEQAVREAHASIRIRICDGATEYADEKWFCPESTQPRTRSRQAWEKRELILEWMPFFIYKLIAG